MEAFRALRNLTLSYQIREFAYVSGWRKHGLINSRNRWIKIQHPPHQRSPIKRIDETSEKIMYVTNGTISPDYTKKWLENAKKKEMFVAENDRVSTPCLVFCKDRNHTLLESLAMEEVLEIESMSDRIISAFKEAESKLGEYKDFQFKHLPLKPLGNP